MVYCKTHLEQGAEGFEDVVEVDEAGGEIDGFGPDSLELSLGGLEDNDHVVQVADDQLLLGLRLISNSCPYKSAVMLVN